MKNTEQPQKQIQDNLEAYEKELEKITKERDTVLELLEIEKMKRR